MVYCRSAWTRVHARWDPDITLFSDCGFPPEYCPWGGKWAACRVVLAAECPELLAAMVAARDVKPDTTIVPAPDASAPAGSVSEIAVRTAAVSLDGSAPETRAKAERPCMFRCVSCVR